MPWYWIEKVLVLIVDVWICSIIFGELIAVFENTPYIEYLVEAIAIAGIYGIYYWIRK